MDENLRKKLEGIAKKRKVTVTSLMRVALIQWLEEQEAQEQIREDWHKIIRRK